MYENGKGVTKDLVKAVEYFQKAADQNEIYAQNSLGIMHMNGKGVEKDMNKAVEYFQKAADQNDVTAINNLKLIRKSQSQRRPYNTQSSL
jgi:TPR repeat protein